MNQYIGIPYRDHGRDHSGVDCWGLVHLWYLEQKAITLPDYRACYQSAGDTVQNATLLAMGRSGLVSGWAPAPEPADGDVLLMRVGKSACHVGIRLGRDFLHCLKGRNSVIESTEAFMWQHAILGGYRWTAT